jgi:hypothetical protein
MKRNRTLNPTPRARQIRLAAGLLFLLTTLPISRNAVAQTTSPPPSGAPATATSVRRPNTNCTFASPDFCGKACATGKLIVFAPALVAGAALIPLMMVM